MTVGVDCYCGQALRSQDQYAGKPVLCPGCGLMYALPAQPGAILPAADAGRIVCGVCGRDFSSDAEQSPVKSGEGGYCHRACRQKAGGREPSVERSSRSRSHGTQPVGLEEKIGLEEEIGLAEDVGDSGAGSARPVSHRAGPQPPPDEPLVADDLWEELPGQRAAQLEPTALESRRSVRHQERWVRRLIWIGGSVPVLLVLLIAGYLIWSRYIRDLRPGDVGPQGTSVQGGGPAEATSPVQPAQPQPNAPLPASERPGQIVPQKPKPEEPDPLFGD